MENNVSLFAHRQWESFKHGRGVGKEDYTGTPNAQHLRLPPEKALPADYKDKVEALRAAALAYKDSLAAPRPASEHIQLLQILADKLGCMCQGVSTLHTYKVIYHNKCQTMRSLGLPEAQVQALESGALDTSNTELAYLVLDLQHSLLRVAEEVQIIDDDQGVPHEVPSDHYMGLRLHPHAVALALDLWTSQDALSSAGKEAVTEDEAKQKKKPQKPLSYRYLQWIACHVRESNWTVPFLLQSSASRDAFGRAMATPRLEVLVVVLPLLHWCLSGQMVPMTLFSMPPPGLGEPFKERPHTHMCALLSYGWGPHLLSAVKSVLSVYRGSGVFSRKKVPQGKQSPKRADAATLLTEFFLYPIFRDATREYARNASIACIAEMSGDEGQCDSTPWPPALIEAHADLAALDLGSQSPKASVYDDKTAVTRMLSIVYPYSSTPHASRALMRQEEFVHRLAKYLNFYSETLFYVESRWGFEIEVIKNLISAADPTDRARICAKLDKEQVPYSLLNHLAIWTTALDQSSEQDSVKQLNTASASNSDPFEKQLKSYLQREECRQQIVKSGLLAIALATVIIQGARGACSYSARGFTCTLCPPPPSSDHSTCCCGSSRASHGPELSGLPEFMESRLNITPFQLTAEELERVLVSRIPHHFVTGLGDVLEFIRPRFKGDLAPLQPALDDCNAALKEQHNGAALEGHENQSTGQRLHTCRACHATAPKMKVCSRCMSQWFCNAECMRKAWPEHRNECRML